MRASTDADDDDNQLTLGQALKALREQRTNLSARALSINAGLSESYVGKLEAGVCEPSARAFAKLAIQLRLKPAEVWVLLSREANR